MGYLLLAQAIDAPGASAPAASDAERVQKALASSLADNPRRAYLGHWAAFSGSCADNGYSPAPAAPETLAEHLAAVGAELAAIRATACARTGFQSGRTESRGRARERGRADIALCSVPFVPGCGDRRLQRSRGASGRPRRTAAGCRGCGARRRTRRRGDARYLPRAAMEALEAMRLMRL